MLLCSDGLWGTVGDPQIADHLSRRPIADAVPELVELALRNGGVRCDNVTAMAVEWEGSGEPDTGASADLGDTGFASTIQGRAGDAGAALELDAMDDEEIERSVREINEAIRRSGKKIKT
jgi:hypothetical protein